MGFCPSGSPGNSTALKTPPICALSTSGRWLITVHALSGPPISSSLSWVPVRLPLPGGQARPDKVKTRQDRREKNKGLHSSQKAGKSRTEGRRQRKKKRAQRSEKPLSPPQPQPIHLLQTPVSRLPSAVFPFQIITDIYWDLFHLLFLPSSSSTPFLNPSSSPLLPRFFVDISCRLVYLPSSFSLSPFDYILPP